MESRAGRTEIKGGSSDNMNTFIFRKSYYSGLTQLKPEKRLEAYEAIMRYAFDGDPVDVSPECAPVLAVIFDSVDADLRKYEQKRMEGQELDD